MTYARLTLKGHKLKRWTSGCEDTYQRGTCECGAACYLWTERYAAVTRWHKDHVESERAKVLPAWDVELSLGSRAHGDVVVHAATARSAALIAWTNQTARHDLKAADLEEVDGVFRARSHRTLVYSFRV